MMNVHGTARTHGLIDNKQFATARISLNAENPQTESGNRNEVSMLTKIMVWASIAVVLLSLLELPVTSEPVLVKIVVCASGLLVIWQAIRGGQNLLRPDSCQLSWPSVPSRPLQLPVKLLYG